MSGDATATIAWDFRSGAATRRTPPDRLRPDRSGHPAPAEGSERRACSRNGSIRPGYFARLLYGARVTLLITLFANLLGLVVGTLVGLFAGYFGGPLDIVLMQLMDALLALPSLILGLLLVAVLGPNAANISAAIAMTLIPAYARVARTPTIAIKQRDYIASGRALGYSDARLMFSHILPNIIPEILVVASLWMASAVRVEASLAFIGLGVRPPAAIWGGMIRDGFETILDGPYLVIFPGLAILILVFALNLMGDGLRDAIDPKLREEC